MTRAAAITDSLTRHGPPCGRFRVTKDGDGGVRVNWSWSGVMPPHPEWDFCISRVQLAAALCSLRILVLEAFRRDLATLARSSDRRSRRLASKLLARWDGRNVYFRGEADE